MAGAARSAARADQAGLIDTRDRRSPITVRRARLHAAAARTLRRARRALAHAHCRRSVDTRLIVAGDRIAPSAARAGRDTAARAARRAVFAYATDAAAVAIGALGSALFDVRPLAVDTAGLHRAGSRATCGPCMALGRRSAGAAPFAGAARFVRVAPFTGAAGFVRSARSGEVAVVSAAAARRASGLRFAIAGGRDARASASAHSAHGARVHAAAGEGERGDDQRASPPAAVPVQGPSQRQMP